MPGRARRKLSKDKGHGIDSADGTFLTLGSPLVSPGSAGCHGPPGLDYRTGGCA